MARSRTLSLAILLLSLAAAGCGEPDPVHVDGTTLELKLDEYRIAPQNVVVDRGDLPLRIVATNTGRIQHNVKVQSLTRTDSEGTPLILGGTKTIRPGQTASATLDLRPGRYRLVCTLGNHDNLGQYGELVVRPRRGM